MLKPSVFALTVSFGLLVATAHPQQEKTSAKALELIPRKPECGILLPERAERHDVARLLGADEFLECERDGFPRPLAPPWKETEEGEKKLGDACEYFAAQSAKKYPHVGQASLTLAADRCRINVMGVILGKTVEGLTQQPPR
ncbi:MAG TPA: hypothetical protein VGM18_05295 [Candidatus Sulfotelmatobacter sp.]|jgi:hypothetical protein